MAGIDNFITTKDIEIAEKLRKLNFVEIANSNGDYTFINQKLTFSENEIDVSKIRYTNKICI